MSLIIFCLVFYRFAILCKVALWNIAIVNDTTGLLSTFSKIQRSNFSLLTLGGVIDTAHQPLILQLMVLTPEDVSKVWVVASRLVFDSFYC